MPRILTFSFVCTLATILCITLCLVLSLMPDLIYTLFALEGSDTADLLAKRAAMLFLGYAVLLFVSRNTRSLETVNLISLAMCVSFAGLVLVGSYEYFSGTAGPGIGLAIGGELFFIVLFITARINFQRASAA